MSNEAEIELSCNTTYAAAQSPYQNFFALLYQYGNPPIIVLGLLGNIASISVCLSPRLRKIPSSLHLSALAFYDSIVLIQAAIIYMNYFGPPTLDTVIGCPILTYILNVFSCLSAWSVTAFTVERFVVVYYPLHRAVVCTTAKARLIISLLIPFPALFNTPSLFMMGMDCGYCDTRPKYMNIMQILGVVDTVLVCVAPSVAVLTLNVLIIRRLAKEREKATDGGPEGESGLRRHNATVNSSKRDQGVTRMLLIVSTCFLALNIPSYSIRLKAFAVRAMNRPDIWTELDQTLEHTFYFLYLINFAIDFLLYSMSSKNFRKIAWELFWDRIKCPARMPQMSFRQSTMTTTSTTKF